MARGCAQTRGRRARTAAMAVARARFRRFIRSFRIVGVFMSGSFLLGIGVDQARRRVKRGSVCGGWVGSLRTVMPGRDGQPAVRPE